MLTKILVKILKAIPWIVAALVIGYLALLIGVASKPVPQSIKSEDAKLLEKFERQK
ncbi:MAG: hypothetical protein HYU57_09815 [Micavibrio aeruginosavorus]|nr:hypothetical protein [Micavibrio aeruginosavorus]